MSKKLEYIWISYNPLEDGGINFFNLRTKTVIEYNELDGLMPSEIIYDFKIRKPVKMYKNPLEDNSILVLCESLNEDRTPTQCNHRFKLNNIQNKHRDEEILIGIEQEYRLLKNGRPLGIKYVDSLSKYDFYCGRNFGEDIAREHMNACIDAGIKILGINSENMLGQWEYQIGTDKPVIVSDDLWVSRWLLEKICYNRGLVPSIHPKQSYIDDSDDCCWPYNSAHTNFSTKNMREDGGDVFIKESVEKLRNKHDEHIKSYDIIKYLSYGDEKKDIKNFTQEHEKNKLTSIRTIIKDGKGYFEDRRPTSNMNPYLVCSKLIETVCS